MQTSGLSVELTDWYDWVNYVADNMNPLLHPYPEAFLLRDPKAGSTAVVDAVIKSRHIC